MKRLIARIKKYFDEADRTDLVWTEDHDGEVRASEMVHCPDGQLIVRAIGDKWIRANEDGTIASERSYVKRWWKR